MAHGLGRRALLRSLAGVGMTLPMLDLFGSRANAGGSGPPRRYVFVFGGVSAGGAPGGQLMIPDAPGPGYDLKRALLALGPGALPYGGTGYDVQDEVSVVSDLEIPWGTQPPPGGRSLHFHANTLGPISSGMRGGTEDTSPPMGRTHDLMVADALAAPGQQRSLGLRVQPTRYVGGSDNAGGDSGRLTWDEVDGELVGVDPFVSPRLTYESLFGNFVPPDPADAQAAAFELARRRSVLETLRVRTAAVMPELGADDRTRMERHLAELAALEAKLAMMPPPTTGACELLPHPGEDPAIGAPFEAADDGHAYDESAAYSDEELRATLMMDYVRMAFACDLTRVAAVRLTMDQAFVNAAPLVGAAADMHQLSHGGGETENHADAVGWHVKHFARLVAMLRDTQELDGSSLLDHTALVFCLEGGFGYDPEAAADDSPHSTQNMVMLVAGRVGGLVHGSHIVANGLHPANVIVTAMHAVGMDVDALGEVSGPVPGLRG
jgi:hypothetical protein